MFRYLASFHFVRFISYMLLLQMINLSISPARHLAVVNGQPTYMEDLSVNRIESIYELVSEFLFQKSVPETQDQGDDGILKFMWIAPSLELQTAQKIAWQEIADPDFHYLEVMTDCLPGEISPPPEC
ncbi:MULTISPECIES: hypothetical protein [Pedobacter]|uniref:hypothetical protein n=1 Tax=Pedobacter TaxID=84567 RepID=UPI00210B3F6F|nr:MULTISPECIES: hypothetical protein [unclassified Pedobacter]